MKPLEPARVADLECASAPCELEWSVFVAPRPNRPNRAKRRLVRTFALLFAVGWLAGCGGSSTLGGKCSTACDCTSTDKPLSCSTGEWTCNDGMQCEYVCQGTCGGGGVGTCAFPAECNTTKMQCSQRDSCH